MIACTVANSAPFRSGRAFQIKDFMPRRGRARRHGSSLDAQKETLAVMALATGGHVDQKILDDLQKSE